MNKKLCHLKTGQEVYLGSYPQHTYTTPGVVSRNFHTLYEEHSLNDCKNVDTIITDASVSDIVSPSLKEDKKDIEEAVKESINTTPTPAQTFERDIEKDIKSPDIEKVLKEKASTSDTKVGSGINPPPQFKVIN